MGAHQVTSKARPGACPVCGEPVVAGVSEGLAVRCDIYPVPPTMEIVAILAGRATFSLFASTLVARAGNSTVPGPVLISHRCGYVLRHRPAAPQPPPQAFVPPF